MVIIESFFPRSATSSEVPVAIYFSNQSPMGLSNGLSCHLSDYPSNSAYV